MDSITTGEKIFNQDIERKKAGTTPNIIMNIQKMTGKVIGQQIQGDVINYNRNHQILSDIFESLEWNEENRQRIEVLERNIKGDQKALEDIKISINKLVEANATNESFISKLKDFAINVSAGISSSLIASAIFAVLGK
jgi:queuine/archaeosine tRNA-ribosyltransferase